MDKIALERAAKYIKGWLRFNYERGDTPGFVVAIAHEGKVIFNEAYGFADLESQTPLTPQHLFRIASHSKTFTATAVMQLQEQGKIRIDDPVFDYVPWLKTHKDKRWQSVTIRQLLSHGAGVIRDGLKNDYWNVEKPFPTEKEFKEALLEADLVIDNNTKLKYSNFGYTLLGMLIAEVSGQPYSQYVVEHIIKPLKLKNTGPELNEQIAPKLVTGYSMMGPRKKRLPISQINTHAMSPATGFYSNAEDLCAYFTAQMTGSGKLLSDESKKEMQKAAWLAENTRDKEEYGLGYEIEYVNDRRLLGHGGGFPGHITKSYFDPKDKLVVIVLTNAMGSWSTYMDKSIIKVLDFFQKNHPNPELEKYEGRYMNLWWSADMVAGKDRLMVGASYSWEPFENADELERINGNVFEISKTDSFNSVGERVEFQAAPDGKINVITYAGATALPEADYIKKMAAKKRVA